MQYSDKPTFYQYWARWLVKLYPVSWRERYGEEMLMTLEDSVPTLKTILNLFINLFDAYLHQNLVKGRTPAMLQRMRSNELVIYGATLIFFAAWFIARPSVDPVVGMTIANSGDFSYTPSHLLINVTQSVFYILLSFILLGGLPIPLATGWMALMTRNRRALLFCFLGVISPLITAFLMILSSVFEQVVGFQGVPATWVLEFIGFIGVDVFLALICFAIQSVAPSRRVTHYALYLAMLIPLVMLVGIVALLFWVLPSFIAAFGASATSYYVMRQGLLLLVMVAALIFALISLIKGFQVKQATEVMLENESEMVM